jgi:hypothetical protein
MCSHGARYFPRQAAGIAVVIESCVRDTPALCAQFVREVTHRREQQNDLFLVMAEVGGFFGQLTHHN